MDLRGLPGVLMPFAAMQTDALSTSAQVWYHGGTAKVTVPKPLSSHPGTPYLPSEIARRRPQWFQGETGAGHGRTQRMAHTQSTGRSRNFERHSTQRYNSGCSTGNTSRRDSPSGVAACMPNRDDRTIIAIVRPIPEKVLQEDPKSLPWYDQARRRSGEGYLC